jgi:hypothetical protein
MRPYPDDFKHPDLPPLPPFISKPGELPGKLGVNRWQYDLWYLIIDSVALGHGDFLDRLTAHPGFQQPAMLSYTVRTAEIDRWFRDFNRNKEYHDCIRPGGFISAWSPDDERAGWRHPGLMQPGPTIEDDVSLAYLAELKRRGRTDAEIEAIKERDPRDWHPIGPFSPTNPTGEAFDRVTGVRIPPWILPNIYAQAL